MSDLISRQEATSLPVLPKEHRKQFKSVDDAFETGWNEALSCVNMLSSADRPTGRWIGEGDGYADGEFVYDTWYCSNCDYVVDDDESPAWNFCPNCGADMRGENEHND